MLLLLSASVLSAQTRNIKVGIYENKPKVFIDEAGNPAGILVDILAGIADNEGWQLQFIPGTWDEGLDRLRSGEIDLMPDVAFTSERATLFSFHKIPVLSSWSQVFSAKNGGIHSVLDLNSRRIAVLEGSIQKEVTESMVKGFDLSVMIIPYPSFELAFLAVKNGEADAVISNNFFGMAQAKELDLEDTAVVFDPANLFYATALGKNKYLLEAIDKHLEKLKKDPQSTYYDAIRKWTFEQPEFIFPLWVKLSALIAAIVLFISLVASFILKKKVKIRTLQLEISNREMEERIISRTLDLEEAMERARDADHLKSAFLATMSHELRTPLNSIIGFTGILLQGLAGKLNAEQNKQLGMVQKSARHLLALINDVLDISKIEAGQLTLAYSEFDLKASLDKLTGMLEPSIKAKGLDLIFECDKRIGLIWSDQRRLEQVILNLLSNAMKFTDHGYVKITAHLDGDYCQVTVQDTGIGMKEEDQSKLFEPFSQIDTGLSRKYEGTGLGLSISKRIITLLGGSIALESVPGEGSIFTIHFPVKHGV
ncbi:MAG: transporter substrate-binding domain-containing protein [Candidatus Cloacimonetes bacterium]|nr:transporter substrate-binding domain-containing protein [Candidatus Cloacimonadota bacterium]